MSTVKSPSFEWTVYDSEKEDFKLVQASNQKEAVRKAFNKYGYVARHTNDARPRTGEAELMKVDEFREWLERHLNL